MNKIAYCGILCEECEIYKATLKDDDSLREAVARKFSDEDYPLKKEDKNCLGCSENYDKLFRFCSECEIRLCAIEREINNCGECKDYRCKKLSKPFEMDTTNKERLDKIFEGRQK
ncbi:MAG: DUF3795 domain-containing protein [Kosmotoga sp.]|jgi:hypothetical protein|nr:MAG: DUF3795 domain-containing protein [Kosmotoga sp.]